MVEYRHFTHQLNASYKTFCEKSLTNRRIKHSDIKPLIEKLRENKIFTIQKAGVSVQNREIYLISAGTGKTKVFLWSQMHGDEPTATMAIFDILNFFSLGNEFDRLKTELLRKLTIYFMPMVNPDGAEVFERRNAFQIDLNRDAIIEQSPEAKVLRNTFDTLKPEFGFNLHDQSIYYSAGRNFKSAAISFLAPPTNYYKTVGIVRKKSMQLIAQLSISLKDFIPGHIGRYSDEYEPRAFGDNFQTWGTSTILIETGGWKGDPEKQFLRKINCIILLEAFKSVAEKAYEYESLQTYENIPLNEKDNIMDLILRNLVYNVENQKILIDIGINRTEINADSAQGFYSIGRVKEIGDLSVYSGYEECNLQGMVIQTGKTFDKIISSEDELKKLNISELYFSGFTNVRINFPVNKDYTNFPFNLILSDPVNQPYIRIEDSANFTISKNDKVKYIVVNGFLISLDHPQTENVNGVVIR
jgi:Zinc carboxypeptidase